MVLYWRRMLGRSLKWYTYNPLVHTGSGVGTLVVKMHMEILYISVLSCFFFLFFFFFFLLSARTACNHAVQTLRMMTFMCRPWAGWTASPSLTGLQLWLCSSQDSRQEGGSAELARKKGAVCTWGSARGRRWTIVARTVKNNSSQQQWHLRMLFWKPQCGHCQELM